MIFAQLGTRPAASAFYLSIATYSCADFKTTFFDEARSTINFHKASSQRARLLSLNIYDE